MFARTLEKAQSVTLAVNPEERTSPRASTSAAPNETDATAMAEQLTKTPACSAK